MRRFIATSYPLGPNDDVADLVVLIERQKSGQFLVTSLDGNVFLGQLTADELKDWARELIDLAESEK